MFAVDVTHPCSSAVVAEWLRRLTRNQFPSGSVGSNPTDCELFFPSPKIPFSGHQLISVLIHCILSSVIEWSPGFFKLCIIHVFYEATHAQLILRTEVCILSWRWHSNSLLLMFFAEVLVYGIREGLSPPGTLFFVVLIEKKLTLAGLEPAIPWFVVRCLIRWATGPPQRFNSLIAIKDEQLLCVAYYTFLSLVTIMRFHGVMVSTQDSESCDPSSNLGGT